MSKIADVKVKVVKDKDLAEMFNQMLGAGTINMNIVYPKYVDMQMLVNKLLDTFRVLNKSPLLNQFPQSRERMANFITRISEGIPKVFSMSFEKYEWNLNLIEDADRDSFAKIYEATKTSEVVGIFVCICNNLCPYRKYFEKQNAKFISQVPGSEFCPFPFDADFNIKGILEQLMLNETANESMIRFIMIVLSKIYELSYSLYRVIRSPDVDVDEFVEVIIRNISEIRKRIPRCDKAFDKIIKSVHMLKENFPSYYSDFIESKNSTIIMENFVIDVSKSTKADAETTRQFKTIIEYYRKISAQQIKNPKVKKLFDAVSENFQRLEKHDNLLHVDECAYDADEDDDAADEVSAASDLVRSSSSQRSPAETQDDIELREKQEANEKKSVDDLLRDIRGSSKKK